MTTKDDEETLLRSVALQNATSILVARQRAIKVGSIAGDAYPVLEGIKAGDHVVVSGVQRLVDGAPIALGS